MDCGVDINHVDNEGMTPLFYCIRSGYLPLIKLLIDKGVDMNHADLKGFTPYQLCKQINASKEIIDLLLKHGAKVVEFLPLQLKSSQAPKKDKKKSKAQNKE
jgi:ankyrin repeat protein